MEIKCVEAGSDQSGSLEVSEHVFGRSYNETLVHQLVTSHLSNGRQATRAQKSRGMVRASGRKPWRQKGTGRARAGTVASPIWRGGGKVFPSSMDENFKKKINKKMFRAGMSTILSQLVREDRLACIEGMVIEKPKTKMLSKVVKGMGLKSVLFVTKELDAALELASRNLPNVMVTVATNLNPIALIKYENTLIYKDAVNVIEEVFI